jgi:hypothetical protein
MSDLARFYKVGVEDADRRVAAALAPVATGAADRYLKTSRVVMAIDRATLRLRDWWHASSAGQALAIAHHGFLQQPSVVRHQAVAQVLLIAVVTHLALMLIQGPRPGWFWIVIPAMAAAFAALLLAGSQSAKSAE